MSEGPGSITEFDPEFGSNITIYNDTAIPDVDVLKSIQEQYPELAALTKWSNSLSPSTGTMLKRERFQVPRGFFNEVEAARSVAEWDDVVSNILDTTEQLAFNRVVVECEDLDEQDIWRQIMDDIDIETRLREMWRELFVSSVVHPLTFMGTAEEPYKVTGKSDKTGTKRKKEYKGLKVPLGISILDPLKIVPAGMYRFAGQEQLVYVADREEAEAIIKGDELFDQIITGKYTPTREELRLLQDETGARRTALASDNLFTLDSKKVFRITATRPGYQRFPTVRMKSIFDLIDMKAQLLEMDRQHLVGASNFILLVTKGTDKIPAKAGEVERLASQVKTAATIPIIISDHRVDIKIITPATDRTLMPERYSVLDSRIAARMYQMFVTGRTSAGTTSDDSTKLIRVVARSMEARRAMIRKAVMKHIIMPVFKQNDQLKSEPMLRFYPSRISLDFDPNFAVYLQDLRDRGDVSRYTTLAEIDLDEADEARKREMESDRYDDIFKPVNVPFSAPVGEDPAQPGETKDPLPGNNKGDGRRGGGKTGGGGTTRESVRSQPGRGPAKEGATRLERLLDEAASLDAVAAPVNEERRKLLEAEIAVADLQAQLEASEELAARLREELEESIADSDD